MNGMTSVWPQSATSLVAHPHWDRNQFPYSQMNNAASTAAPANGRRHARKSISFGGAAAIGLQLSIVPSKSAIECHRFRGWWVCRQKHVEIAPATASPSTAHEAAKLAV